MKPIRLQFSGLQSYRLPQEINFAELGVMGIFGVFGPTGGGKSTILDAITLALFGKVERANRGTRGIINDLESKVSVSFEFALGNDVFRVERLYERDKKDKDSVKNSNARFINVSGGSNVIADRVSEVDSRVNELLGMGMEDFSRAVVLPQGKFDQFLKLTGGDRAKMLEHIFLLEQYGENLYRKASNMEDGLKKELDTTQRLIEQLGDASPEAVTALEEQLAKVKAEVTEKDKVLKQVQIQLHKAEKAKTIFDELQEQEKLLKGLTDREPEVNTNRFKLDKAEKAEPFRRFITQFNDLTQKEANEQSKLRLLMEESKNIKVRFESAERLLEQAKSYEPQLNQLRKENLPNAKLAVANANQCRELKKQANATTVSIDSLRMEMQKLEEQGKNRNLTLKELQQTKERNQEQIQSVSSLLAFRSEIEANFSVLADFEVATKNAKESMGMLREKENQVNQRKQELLNHLSTIIPIESGVDTEELIAKAATVLDHQESRTKEASEQIERIMQQDMAGTLAKHLVSGEPCPVCGSLEHPITCRENISLEELNLAKANLEQAEKTLQQVRDWYNQAVTLHTVIQTISNDIEKTLKPAWLTKNDEVTAIESKMVELYKGLVQQVQSISKTVSLTPCENMEDIAKELNHLRIVKESAEKNLAGFIEDGAKLEKRIGDTEKEISDLRSKYSEYRTQSNGYIDQVKQIENQIKDLRDKISLVTGGITAEEYETQIIQKIASMEKQNEEALTGWELIRKESQENEQNRVALMAGINAINEHLQQTSQEISRGLSLLGLQDVQEITALLLEPDSKEQMKAEIVRFDQLKHTVHESIRLHQTKLLEEPFYVEEYEKLQIDIQSLKEQYDNAVKDEGAIQTSLSDVKERHEKWKQLKDNSAKLARRSEVASNLISLIKGRKFVQFLAEEHLADMTVEASMRLGALTGQRYGLELDDGFNFALRDEYSGGLRRPVNSLSGGETFLTSLSMALALSSKIQLKGKYPLGFFFLDEGFGTLDPEKLELVMNTLEHLYDGHRTVGIITHVQELKNRMPRYLEVIPASLDGEGSKVVMK